MVWVKAFHIVFMVTWFSGLFYLPRLFVYHAEARDAISIDRFKLMEKKLFYMITTPSAVLTILFGTWLISFNPEGYMQMHWLQIKLGFVLLLMMYHAYLGKLLLDFTFDRNLHGSVFYRWLNEIPAIFLIIIVILAVVKPFSSI